MSDSLPYQCTKITSDLINDPLSHHFANPNTPDKKFQNSSDISSKFKPMGLSLVRKKIKDNNYSSFQEWVDDMNLIYDNAINYYGQNSLFGGVAVYLKKQLGKKIREIELMNSRNYENQLISLRNQIEETLQNPPLTLSVTCSYDMSSKDCENFTVSRINNLREKLMKMVANDEDEEILKCINESNSEYNYTSGQEIDLSHLGRHTLLCLEKLVSTI